MTREQAIEIVKTQYPHNHVMKTALGLLIPELRESEDERIRKVLMEYFGPQVQLDFVRGVPIQKIRAWLEKQKESHIPWYDYQKSKEAGYTIVPNGEYEQLIKQKEQNPAWSEEDEDMLNSCISSIEEAKENRYAYKETDGDTSYDHEIAWLKSLRPSWKPSKEQIKALEIAFRKDGDDKYRSTINSLYNDLKKL